MAYLDFRAIKALASIEAVADWLGISAKLKRDKDTYRGKCPFCDKGGDRSFVITPSKGLWNSFCGCCKGGDAIALVAQVRQVPMRDAAALILERFGNSTEPSKETVGTVRTNHATENSSQELKPLQNLTHDHEVIEMLGLSKPVCEAVGIGFCGKGLMKDRVVFPIRLPSGELLAYMGLATKPEQQPLLKFPDNVDARLAAPKPQQQTPPKDPADMRKLLRVVS